MVWISLSEPNFFPCDIPPRKLRRADKGMGGGQGKCWDCMNQEDCTRIDMVAEMNLWSGTGVE